MRIAPPLKQFEFPPHHMQETSRGFSLSGNRKAQNSRSSTCTYIAARYLIADERAGMNLNFGAGAPCINSSTLVPIEVAPHAGNVRRFPPLRKTQNSRNSTYLAEGCLVADKRAVMNLDFGV